MDNILLRILLDSFERQQKPETGASPGGPFITISREYGCQANVLAESLSRAIAAKGSHWRIMNKEIILEAARELNLDPDKIKAIEGSMERGAMDEILSSLTTKYYKSDRKVRQTIANVVMSAAHTGNVIIVGRGGAAVTMGWPNALHIKLTAPVQWRLDTLIARHNLKREETVKQMASIDHKRFKMQRDYLKGGIDINDLYDLVINCSKVTHPEIVGIVISMLESRKMI
ncbi:cytidylate kinase-like family [Lentimicrobium saccharophilum]|uniref:Cytidylate kinase-like family n=1 Tax=Lentimicrobium saccharophilum TaxID=1678841 RepID=A0A0S7BYT9_9BACT|nr:cytidylate kinase-like family protein [Lentimicrobium saccharophilum]GAP42134.1 cytidylate kinase-like family [Lentimicrobium saccharophilum]